MEIERELKFRITPPSARRVWRLVRFTSPPRRQSFSAVYYDTKRARLRRARAELRLRREGGRWVQTMKADTGVPGGLPTRAEWQLPAPGRKLDIAAFPRDSINATTGLDLRKLGPKLKPLFETRFSRRAGMVDLGGGARAELSVDRGRISAARQHLPILELELELKAGDPRRLIRFAEELAKPLGLSLEFASKAQRGYRLAAGDPAEVPRKWIRPGVAESATPGEAFAAQFAAALQQAGANAHGLLGSSDPEFLHQMRVGLRRLRSLLRVYRGIVPRKESRPLTRALRRLTPALGAARDWDVFCEWLASEARSAGPDAGEVRAVLARARARRQSARRLARETVSAWRFQRLFLRAILWLADAPWSRRPDAREVPAPEFARHTLERLHGKTIEYARHIDWDDVERRHALRVKVKRLRYATGYFARSFPNAAVRPYLRRLQNLQDILGELNDVAVARRFLMELVPRGPVVGQRAGARLWRSLAAREIALIASLEPAWRSFQKRGAFWRPPRRGADRAAG
jgi:inorganic triphosphatase YgiF